MGGVWGNWREGMDTFVLMFEIKNKLKKCIYQWLYMTKIVKRMRDWKQMLTLLSLRSLVSEVLTSSFLSGWCRLPAAFTSVLPQLYPLPIHPLTIMKPDQLSLKTFFLWFQYHRPPFQELGVSTQFQSRVKREVTPVLGFDGFFNFTYSLSKGWAQKVWGQGRCLSYAVTEYLFLGHFSPRS